jgi:hypothetical protein
MADYQDIKKTVRSYQAALDGASADDAISVLTDNMVPEFLWRGMHPFYEQYGADNVAAVFWAPLKKAFTTLHRREDIFMAGTNAIENGEWVCSSGHFSGLFDNNWLGITATHKLTFIPYVEFTKVENGKISEVAFFCDIISVMQQAGVNVLPEQTASDIIRPGPATHDGLLHNAQNPTMSAKTLALVTQMCDDLTGSGMGSPDEQLRQTWHDNMYWFGPSGIGSTYTVERYQHQHQGPFERHLGDIKFNGHVCRFAEGDFACWFGWPNLSMKSTGGFLGMPASDIPADMRVVDIYRRDGDKLAENWVYIDILHFLSMQGLDILKRVKEIRQS